MDEKKLTEQDDLNLEPISEETAPTGSGLFIRSTSTENEVTIEEPASFESLNETTIVPPEPPLGEDTSTNEGDSILTFNDLDVPLPDNEGADEPPLPPPVKKKHKKAWIITGVIVALLLTIYLGLSFYFSSHFYFNATINGFEVGGKTAEEVDKELQQSASAHTLTLKERNDKSETIAADQINIQYVSDGKVLQLLESQNPFAWPVELLSSRQQNPEVTFTYDDAKLTATLNQLQAVSGAEVVKVVNAYPKYNGTNFAIIEEVTGNELDAAKLKESVKKAILSGSDSLDLEATGCYKKPAYTKDSQKVKDANDKMNQYLNATVTYTFGDAKEVLDRTTISSWLSVDENLDIQFDQNQMGTYVANLSDKYDTYGTTRSFQTSGGGVVNVGGGDYGWLIDQDEEIAALIPVIQAGQHVTREPVYAQKAASRSARDYGNTYVEISIAGQYMWFYQNGSLVVGTPIVTGSLSGGFGTPTGIYDLDYKAMNVTLKGEGYASPVTFWMPYGGDIGIHDASWRSDFGGNIYVNSGSHGCVNTPYAAAQAIYNGISDGDPVIVY